jgi:hypothetical protein
MAAHTSVGEHSDFRTKAFSALAVASVSSDDPGDLVVSLTSQFQCTTGSGKVNDF